MAINYSAPRIAARNIVTSTPNININEALGLRSSPYQGLQQVGGQNLYYGDGGFYESYSPTPSYFYRNNGPFGVSYYSNPYAQYGISGGGPSYSPIFGYSGGWQRGGGDVAGTIRRDGQAFKPYTGEIPAGFVKFGDKYEPSMSYLYARSQPQVTAQPNRMFNYASGFTPATNNVYQQATGNLLPSPTNNRFLNTGNLLGPMFSPTQQVGNYTSSYTPQSGYLTPPSMFFNRLNSTNVPILNLFGTLGNAGALNNMSYTNSATGFNGTVGEAQAASV